MIFDICLHIICNKYIYTINKCKKSNTIKMNMLLIECEKG